MLLSYTINICREASADHPGKWSTYMNQSVITQPKSFLLLSVFHLISYIEWSYGENSDSVVGFSQTRSHSTHLYVIKQKLVSYSEQHAELGLPITLMKIIYNSRNSIHQIPFSLPVIGLYCCPSFLHPFPDSELRNHERWVTISLDSATLEFH